MTSINLVSTLKSVIVSNPLCPKELFWFSTRRQLSIAQPLTHSSQVGWGENQKGKSVRTHGFRYRQFTRQSKIYARKQSKTRNSFATSHWQADVQPLPGKPGSSPVMVSWRTNAIIPSVPPSSFTPAFIAEHDVAWYGLTLVSPGQLLALSPPSFWCTPSLLAGRAAGEAEKSLALCEHCSNTSVCYHCYFHQKSKM